MTDEMTDEEEAEYYRHNCHYYRDGEYFNHGRLLDGVPPNVGDEIVGFGGEPWIVVAIDASEPIVKLGIVVKGTVNWRGTEDYKKEQWMAYPKDSG